MDLILTNGPSINPSQYAELTLYSQCDWEEPASKRHILKSKNEDILPFSVETQIPSKKDLPDTLLPSVPGPQLHTHHI